MKKTVILFLCMLVTFSAFSKIMDSRDIHLKARKADKDVLRSVIPVRSSLEGNTILINFFNAPRNVTVTVLDAEGNKVFIEAYSSPQIVKLQALYVSGSYTLEVAYEDTCLYGDFAIE